jgi:hypothetical protein
VDEFKQLNPSYLINDVAKPVADYCTKQYGKAGLKIEKELKAGLQWRPSIQIKTSKFQILAIEVSDLIYPAVVKTVAHDLLVDHADVPISVSVACPLSVYQADLRHAEVSRLKSHGFGLFTVDDVGHVIEQIPAVALIHHIPENVFAKRLEGLPQKLKVLGRKAFGVYKEQSYQGVQDIGQVIEALIFSFAAGAEKKGWITKVRKNAADVIDDLYESKEKALHDQRAAIGHARAFMKKYRNASSHPPKTAAAAADLIKRCREGFLTATDVIADLNAAIRACGLTARLNIP